jgi:glycosyltransferase involved in cell wall biosynthesis
LLADLSSALKSIHIFAICELGPDDVKGTTESISQRYPNLSILEMDAVFGRGAALRAGLARTHEDVVAFVDLNASVAPESIARSFDELAESRADGLVYDRFASGKGRSDRQALLTRLVNVIARVTFGIDLGDVRSPLKVFRRATLVRIFEGLRLYAHGFDIDLLFNAKMLGCRIEERSLPSSNFSIEVKRTGDVLSTVPSLLALRCTTRLCEECRSST